MLGPIARAGTGEFFGVVRAFSRSLTAVAIFGAVASALLPAESTADENGISFWIPGQFGSFAALPGQPGWSFATIYYHTSLSAGGGVSAGRQVSIGQVSRNINVNLNADLKAQADLQFLIPTYTFQTPVLGGQLAVSMASSVGYNSSASVNGTLTTNVGSRQGSISDSRGGYSDLYPMATLKWHNGPHNYMAYLTGDIPVGSYDPHRLANFGIGHGAIDGGIGYTYLDLASGYEVSAVTGLTYNLKNYNTDYQNGVDWHLDWAASRFLSKQVHVGAVGYVYQQLNNDSGAPAFLDNTKSSVVGAGPQIGYLFPVGDLHGYLNVKGYYEVDSTYRPKGWNTWLTLSITPGAPKAATVRGH
jgi:hypothetical protein